MCGAECMHPVFENEPGCMCTTIPMIKCNFIVRTTVVQKVTKFSLHTLIITFEWYTPALCTISYLCALTGLRCCKYAVCVIEGLNIAISICIGSATSCGFAQEAMNILDLVHHKCDHQKLLVC